MGSPNVLCGKSWIVSTGCSALPKTHDDLLLSCCSAPGDPEMSPAMPTVTRLFLLELEEDKFVVSVEPLQSEWRRDVGPASL